MVSVCVKVSVCVSSVTRCQWCQYVSVVSVCVSAVSGAGVSVCVSMCQFCSGVTMYQYVSVVSVCVSVCQ